MDRQYEFCFSILFKTICYITLHTFMSFLVSLTKIPFGLLPPLLVVWTLSLHFVIACSVLLYMWSNYFMQFFYFIFNLCYLRLFLLLNFLIFPFIHLSIPISTTHPIGMLFYTQNRKNWWSYSFFIKSSRERTVSSREKQTGGICSYGCP